MDRIQFCQIESLLVDRGALGLTTWPRIVTGRYHAKKVYLQRETASVILVLRKDIQSRVTGLLWDV